jgi:hypothetical protein
MTAIFHRIRPASHIAGRFLFLLILLLPARAVSDTPEPGWPRIPDPALPFVVPAPVEVRATPEREAAPAEETPELLPGDLPKLPPRGGTDRRIRRAPEALLDPVGRSQEAEGGYARLVLRNEFSEICLRVTLRPAAGEESIYLVLAPGHEETVELKAGNYSAEREMWRCGREDSLREEFAGANLRAGWFYEGRISAGSEQRLLRQIDTRR